MPALDKVNPEKMDDVGPLADERQRLGRFLLVMAIAILNVEPVRVVPSDG